MVCIYTNLVCRWTCVLINWCISWVSRSSSTTSTWQLGATYVYNVFTLRVCRLCTCTMHVLCLLSLHITEIAYKYMYMYIHCKCTLSLKKLFFMIQFWSSPVWIILNDWNACLATTHGVMHSMAYAIYLRYVLHWLPECEFIFHSPPSFPLSFSPPLPPPMG